MKKSLSFSRLPRILAWGAAALLLLPSPSAMALCFQKDREVREECETREREEFHRKLDEDSRRREEFLRQAEEDSQRRLDIIDKSRQRSQENWEGVGKSMNQLGNIFQQAGEIERMREEREFRKTQSCGQDQACRERVAEQIRRDRDHERNVLLGTLLAVFGGIFLVGIIAWKTAPE